MHTGQILLPFGTQLTATLSKTTTTMTTTTTTMMMMMMMWSLMSSDIGLDVFIIIISDNKTLKIKTKTTYFGSLGRIFQSLCLEQLDHPVQQNDTCICFKSIIFRPPFPKSLYITILFTFSKAFMLQSFSLHKNLNSSLLVSVNTLAGIKELA